MGHIKWYECQQCGHTESKLKSFKKAGKIEDSDGKKRACRKCPECGDLTYSSDLLRTEWAPTTKKEIEEMLAQDSDSKRIEASMVKNYTDRDGSKSYVMRGLR